jgi:hypothetical protein
MVRLVHDDQVDAIGSKPAGGDRVFRGYLYGKIGTHWNAGHDLSAVDTHTLKAIPCL